MSIIEKLKVYFEKIIIKKNIGFGDQNEIIHSLFIIILALCCKKFSSGSPEHSFHNKKFF